MAGVDHAARCVASVSNRLIHCAAIMQAVSALVSLALRELASNPALPTRPRTLQQTVAARHRARSASGTCHPQAACHSTENAASSGAPTGFVRITHPFHPLSGQRLPCVGKRYNRHGERLLLQDDGGAVWSVAPQWTDLVGLDPEVVMGSGRALFRVAELVELACLVRRLSDNAASPPRGNL